MNMPTATPHLDRFLRKTARRLWLHRASACFQRIMYPACAAAAVVFILQTLTGIRAWPIAAGVLLVAWIAAVVLALRKRPALRSVAAELDRRLNTRDLLSTSYGLRSSPQDLWTAAVVFQAEEMARTGSAADVITRPVSHRLTAGWVLLNGLILAWLFLPRGVVATPADNGQFVSLRALRQQVNRYASDVRRNAPSSSSGASNPAGKAVNQRRSAAGNPVRASDVHASPDRHVNVSQGSDPAAGRGARRAGTASSTGRPAPAIDPPAVLSHSDEAAGREHPSGGSGLPQLRIGRAAPSAGSIAAEASTLPPAPNWPGSDSAAPASVHSTDPSSIDMNTIPSPYRDLVRAFFNRDPRAEK